MKILYDPQKSEKLKKERNVSFQDIEDAILEDGLLDVLEHPNKKKYGHQQIMVVKLNDYVYMVPFVQNKEGLFLKTAFASRKYKKIYMSDTHEKGGYEKDEENK